jgi:hypothetical protein
MRYRGARTHVLGCPERCPHAICLIEALPVGHPRKTHVCFMTLYAREILTGQMPGRYRDEDAERFVLLALCTAA